MGTEDRQGDPGCAGTSSRRGSSLGSWGGPVPAGPCAALSPRSQGRLTGGKGSWCGPGGQAMDVLGEQVLPGPQVLLARPLSTRGEASVVPTRRAL